MRTWYPVSVPAFYNPVTSLLKPIGEKDTWSGMRTTGQLRLAHGIKLKANKDSLYKVQSRICSVDVCHSEALYVMFFCGLNFQVESRTLNLSESAYVHRLFWKEHRKSGKSGFSLYGK